jgi:hypothetical protein
VALAVFEKGHPAHLSGSKAIDDVPHGCVL